MKKVWNILYFTFILCLYGGLLTGCSDEMDDSGSINQDGKVMVRVQFDTRSGDSGISGDSEKINENESRIKTVRLYAFDGDILDNMVYKDTLDNTTGSVSIKMEVSSGNRSFYAIINEPDKPEVHSALALVNHPNGIKQAQYQIGQYLLNGDEKIIVNVLKKHGNYTLPMYGKLSSVAISTTTKELDMQVSRAVARIDVYMAKAVDIMTDAITEKATLKVDAASQIGYISDENVISTIPVNSSSLDTPVDTTLSNFSTTVTGNGYAKIYSFYIPEQACPEEDDRLVFTVGGIKWKNLETTYNPFILGNDTVNTDHKLLTKIERNKVYRIFCRMSPSTKNISLDVLVSPWNAVVPQDSIFHPGKLGMTNCYIVNPGRSVSIPVMNVYKIWNWQFGQKLSPKREVKAKLIWQDTPGLITEVTPLLETKDYSYSKIQVTTAKGKFGNAVVGMWIDGDNDDNNNPKTYRWSWHIWIPEEQPKAIDLGGMVAMDRNLGAVIKNSVDDNPYLVNGLFYQWGRKDPFPAARDWYGRTEVQIYNMEGSVISFEPELVKSGTGLNLYNAIHYPAVFYFSAEAICDWYTENGAQNDTLWDVNKTIYDPCPEGWKIPSDMKVWDTWRDDVIFPFKDNVGYGRYHSNTNSFYPATGTKSGTNGKVGGSGANGYWWCVSNSFSFYDLGTGANINPMSKKAYGYSIRCVKE